jgi:hypothetical protein
MRALLLVPLLLLACGPREPPPAQEPLRPEYAECRAEARADPEWRAVFRRASPNTSDGVTSELAVTENRLVRACLERRGVIRGGVAPVRR